MGVDQTPIRLYGHLKQRFFHTSNTTDMERGYSYSCRLIVDWLKQHKHKFEAHSTLASHAFVDTGLRVDVGEHVQLSIQTDPLIANSAFAETALITDGEYAENDELGYDDVRRFDSPDELFTHIQALIEKVLNRD